VNRIGCRTAIAMIVIACAALFLSLAAQTDVIVPPLRRSDTVAAAWSLLVTLKEAGNYTTRLPKAEHEAAEWQAAMEALILVATSGGPTMFAHIGVMRALNRHVERVFNPDRKDHHWGRRKLARDR
jgi:hypothetical protein